MGDWEFGIERARRRDWGADYEDDGTGTPRGAPGEHPERAARDAAAADRLSRWIQGSEVQPASSLRPRGDGPGPRSVSASRSGVSVPADDGPDDDTYTMYLPGPDTCLTTTHPAHDFDQCVFDLNPGGLQAPFKASTPFLREEKDAAYIDPADVRQNLLGDCHLMAPLAAMASTLRGRAAIYDAISEQKNDKGEVVAYSVHLYEASGAKPTAIQVPAGAPYVVGHALARGDERTYEIWPLLMEKAYAQLRGGYNVIGRHAEVEQAMHALTGGAVQGFDPRAVPRDVWTDPTRVVVLSSAHGIEPNPYKLKQDHAYALTSRVVDGQSVVQLYNPWGREQPEPIPLDRLAAFFTRVDVASLGARP